MFPIYILAVIFTGVIGITYVDGYLKLKKEQLKASKKNGGDSELTGQIDRLTQQNRDLQRRIENLEAIVVDSDLRVDTGLDSRIDQLRERQSRRDPNELEL